MNRAVLFAATGSLLALMAVGAVLFARRDHGRVDAAVASSAPKVALMTAERQVLRRFHRGVGVLEASRQVLVTTGVAGRISAIHFDSGQRATIGDRLITLSDAPEQAERERLSVLLKHAEARLARIRQLMPSRAATQEQLDQAIADRDAARSALHRIQAVITQKQIHAPFDGTLGVRLVQVGEYLQSGDEIVALANNSGLRVNFSLTEQARADLHLGQPVELRFPAIGSHVSGRINAIDPVIGKSGMVRMQATLDQDDPRLSAGMSVEVHVARPDRGPVIAVPRTAVVNTAYGDTVFVASPDSSGLRAHRVSVRTGETDRDQVEILEGLTDGDRVVVSGQVKLHDGGTLQPVDAWSANAADKELSP